MSETTDADDQTVEEWAAQLISSLSRDNSEAIESIIAHVVDEVRRETLAEFTEEVTVRMVARHVPCDCPGDWPHHARIVGDDSPATHVRHDMVPSRRYVTPWEPTT